MVPQIANREPKILLGVGAENLGRGPLVLRLLGAEVNSTTPYPILSAPNREPNGDTLSFEFDGGKIVNDCFAYRRGY